MVIANEVVMKKLHVFWLGVLLFAACSDNANEAPEPPVALNRFADTTLQQIYTHQDERNTAALLPYLSHENNTYREAATLAFGSVQDTNVIEQLAPLLNDKEEAIQKAAAYSMGQTRSGSADGWLQGALGQTTSHEVKKVILEALGKCGDENTLNFIISFATNNDPLLMEGQMWALYQFGLQRITSKEGTALAVQMLDASKPYEVRFAAAHYLARASIDLKDHTKAMLQHFEDEPDIMVLMNIARALRKTQGDEVATTINKYLRLDTDYRALVNTISACHSFWLKYDEVNEVLFEMLNHPNTQVAVKAAEYFAARGQEKDVERYLTYQEDSIHWRVRAKMMEVALDKCNKAQRNEINAIITSLYENTSNPYEKGALLTAMSADTANRHFVAEATFNAKEKVISTNGIEALGLMLAKTQFTNNKLIADTATARIFLPYWIKAVQSGDVAMIGSASKYLTDTLYSYNTTITDDQFLKDALANMQLPIDIEGYAQLLATIDYFEGNTTPTPVPDMMNNPIDWELVCSIPEDQQVVINTDKGDITLQLMINDAPGSVSNFIRLIRDGFYGQSVAHRVVPNFVVQDGCPRGDGWGGPTFSIRSEFGALRYETGTVGMASAGKDTESSQWFITHSPTPHLNGRYSIFAQVVKGMEVVHQLEMGDRMLGFEIK